MTEYKVLAPEADISSFFGEPHRWPTVVAIRDNRIIGAISTHDRDGVMVCGPMLVKVPGRTVFVAFRLIEEYDRYMKELGIVCYYLGLKLDDPAWICVMDKFSRRYADSFPIERIGGNDGQMWYRRLLVSRRSLGQLLRWRKV